MTIRAQHFMAAAAFLAISLAAPAAEYFVSEAGSGRKGTKEEPVKDLGNLAAELKAGDVVNIAGGTYLGRTESGQVTVNVPVKIYGGWDAAFAKRDPWGATRTIFSGDNKSKNFNSYPRLDIDLSKSKEPGEVVVDGIIVDNAGRNRYSGDGARIERKAQPSTGENASPDTAGIRVKLNKGSTATVENCVVINCAPTQGVLSVWGHQDTKAVIRNNLVVNNTGLGIEANTQSHPRDGKGLAEFRIAGNTVLFAWKYDPLATYGGSGLAMDADVSVVAEGNVFAFSDIAGVYNAKKAKSLTLKDNFLKGNLQADYLEFSTKMDVKAMADDAQNLSKDSAGNVTGELALPVSKAWAERYSARSVIDRNAAEAEVKVAKTKMNEWRAALGLPLQGTDLKVDSEVWLHRMSLEDALKCGAARVQGKYGCEKPAVK